MKSAALIETRGVPIDTELHARLLLHREPIRDGLIAALVAEYPIYEGRTFKASLSRRNLIPGSHGSWPAELVSPSAHDAAGGFEVALDQEPHGDRGRVPTTGGQSSEDRVARGFFVEMERLRIELGAECLDPLPVDPHP